MSGPMAPGFGQQRREVGVAPAHRLDVLKGQRADGLQFDMAQLIVAPAISGALLSRRREIAEALQQRRVDRS